MNGAIGTNGPIGTDAASGSLSAPALASSPKKTSIYLYKMENPVTDAQALPIVPLAPIGDGPSRTRLLAGSSAHDA